MWKCISREMVEELVINCGIDIVKVGIGSGVVAQQDYKQV